MNVPFAEFELAQVEKEVGAFCRRRSPLEVRSKLTIGYRANGYDVIVYERRPQYDGSPGFTESAVAKLKLTRKTGKWRLFWMRANRKWVAYETRSSSGRLHDLISEIDADEYGCFFG